MKSKIYRSTAAPFATIATIATLAGFVPGAAFADTPTRPGQPTGTISNSTVSLNWSASSDSVRVAGYNVYINNQYVGTVSGNRYMGSIDASRANTAYVVAFDEGNNGSNRSFSARSPESNLRVQTSSTPASSTPTANAPAPRNTGGPNPTAPTNVVASRTSDSTVSLTWTASSDDVAVAGYNVYRGDRYVTTVTNPRLTDIQLNANDDYNYYVVAFDEPRNFSPRSAIASTAGGSSTPAPVSPPTTPAVSTPVVTAPVSSGPDNQRPDIVRNVSATASNGNINVQWDAGTDNVGVDGYNVSRNGSYVATVFGTSYTDTSSPSLVGLNYSINSFDAARNYSRTSVVAPVGPTPSDNTTTPTVTPPTVTTPTVTPPVVTTPVVDTGTRGTIPTLADPFALPIPSPNPADPFGSLLEIDNEAAVAGGPPTQPKNVRAELVSNDWAEINWAPSNDDGEVVEYRIYRSDGVTYTVREDQVLSNTGNQPEIDRFWRSTIFIDCNYTRFFTEVHDCSKTTPNPGDTYTYEISAIDDEGQESARSEPLEIVYHKDQNAPIPYYDDFYKEFDDRFVQEHDLSSTEFFLDEFVPVFDEEFDGTEINEDHWNTSLVWGDTQIINGEQQYFVNTQAQPNFGHDPFNLTGDTLVIESIPTPANLEDNLPPICDEPDPIGKDRCAFLSGALSSHDKFGITYGYVESRMKVGSDVGSLSSFYLFNRYPGTGRNLHAPEIDIVEYLGENPFGDELAFQTYHYANVNDGSTNSAPTMSFANPDGTKYDEDFHTFGVLWEPQLVIWYIDGQEIKRMTGPQVSRQRMNIVTYLVSGSAWAPTPDINGDNFPLTLEIDYIKAYQRPVFSTNGNYP